MLAASPLEISDKGGGQGLRTKAEILIISTPDW
jgi:hypothetical protein